MTSIPSAAALLERNAQLEAQVQALKFQVDGTRNSAPGGSWSWPDVASDRMYCTSDLIEVLQLKDLSPGNWFKPRSIAANVHKGDLERLRKQLVELRERGGLYASEYRWIIDGVPRWARTFGEFIKHESGTVSARGTTTLLVSETQLGRERDTAVESLHALMQTKGVHLWTWPSIGTGPFDISGMPSVVDDWGQDDNATVSPWRRYVHPDDFAAFSEQLGPALDKPDQFSIEVRARLTSPEYRWYECRGASEYTSGRRLKAAGTLFDIEDRKQFELRAKISRDTLGLVIEGARGGVWDWPNVTEDYLDIGDSMSSLLEYSLDEVSPSLDWFWSVTHPNDYGELKAKLSDTFATGAEFNHVYRIRFKHKGYRHVRSVAKLSRDSNPDGDAHRLTGMLIDVEDEWQSATNLEKANEHLDSFAYLIAHDLGASLRHILSFADIIVQDHGPELSTGVLAYLAKIVGSGRKATNMIADLYAYARTGTTQLNKQVVSLPALIDTIVETLTQGGVANHVTWEIGELPNIYADETQMHMLFQNLLSNAIKFTRNTKGAAITIQVIDQNEAEVTIQVADNGPGFNPALSKQIFEAFRRAHTDSEYEGMGIGLSHVARIVDRHSGRITATSREGKGAEFSITLPRGFGAA